MIWNLRPIKVLLLCLGIISGTGVYSQPGHYWSSRYTDMQIEKFLTANGDYDFMSVKPFAVKDITGWLEIPKDTAALFSKVGSSFWEPPNPGRWKVTVIPLADFSVGFSNYSNGIYTTAVGMATNISYGQKWNLYVDLLTGESKQPQYLQDYTDSSGVIISRGKNRATDGNPSFINPTLRLSFAPSQYFNFEIGNGSHFFGQGYRSLYLSDASYNHPYLKITTDVWRFKYINLFSALKGSRGLSVHPKDFESKYTTTHYLNWAVTPKFNLGLFETMVWQGRDTLLNRGFDPNYLNPIIFYRPVEYSIGSPDNALIGMDVSYKVKKDIVAYGQFVIDEFLLSEFRDRTGWWANKWAAQAGFKFFDFMNVEDLYLQTEINIVRPFTYTHGSALQNFGHYNQPLAHPLGANFYEALLKSYYQKNNWYAELLAIYSRYGTDPEDKNMGSDIFKSYVNPTLIRGNTIAQGLRGDLYFQRLKLGYVLNPQLNLRAALIYSFRYNHVEKQVLTREHMVGIELATYIFKRNNAF